MQSQIKSSTERNQSGYCWYGMVWCPSYPLDRNRCDQVVAAGSGASGYC
jgi:hypothetical protein